MEYDDQQYVTENPHVQAGLTWSGFKWAFGFHAANWHPLTWISHMLDVQLFGAWAGGHHLTSILLHCLSAVLLFVALRRLTESPWTSVAVAAIFAWHPAQVESVAWVAERKDVLCGFFWMLTLWSYSRYAKSGNVRVATPGCSASGAQGSRGWYGAVIGFLAFALMSKPMAVTLPFVLLLLDVWPLRRIEAGRLAAGGWQCFVEKVPMFLLVAGSCSLTIRAQSIAMVSQTSLPIRERCAHGLLAFAHYLRVFFVPTQLAVYYPYERNMKIGAVVAAAGLASAITVWACFARKKRPWVLVGWLWFAGTLVPVIGLVQVGDQAWADRYTYLPLVGLALGCVWLAAHAASAAKWVAGTVMVVIGMVMVVLTSFQIGYWRNTSALFEHAKSVTSRNYLAETVLGSVLAQQGKVDQAKQHYQQALAWKPEFPQAHFLMGAALDAESRLEDALSEYRQALWYKPTAAQTYMFMGLALGKLHRTDDAIAHYAAALKAQPDFPAAENNLARLFHSRGDVSRAAEHYRAALALDPKLTLAHNNLGVLLLQQGGIAEATRHLREALRLNPTNSETQVNLALALQKSGNWLESSNWFAQGIKGHRVEPGVEAAFGSTLLHLNQTRAAVSHYASALLVEPDNADALSGLAWILSTTSDPDLRNPEEALKMARRGCELAGNRDAEKLKALAAAYADNGNFAEAIQTAQAGLVAAPANSTLQRMLAAFKENRPWRDK